MRVIFRNKEAQLIQGCRKKNRKAQKELFERYCDQMFVLCLRYVNDHQEAKDLLQDSFITVFEKINSYQEKGSFEGWMKRIFINNCLMYCRKKKKNQTFSIIEDINVIQEENDWKSPIPLQDLLRLIQSLPEGYRNVFNLYVLDNYKHPEIAEILGISENTSKSQLSRARKLLQKMIEQEKIMNNDE